MGFMSDMLDPVYNNKPKKENQTINDHKLLLSSEDKQPLYEALGKDFNLGGFHTLAEIIDNLGVEVNIEPEIFNQEIPSGLEQAEAYWQDEVIRLQERCGKENSDYNKDQLCEARNNLEMIQKEKGIIPKTRLRGRYKSKEKVIELFPDEMKTEYDGNRMKELLVTTLIHETMHAYFDRPGHNNYPYVYFVEEPLAEFGKLLYLHETKSQFYGWAYDDVNNKLSYYQYGARLMDRHLAEIKLGESSAIRKYLEDYKIFIDCYQMPELGQTSQSITMPNEGNVAVNADGNIIRPVWKDVFQIPPRYFYDAATQTLGLDGDWSSGHGSKNKGSISAEIYGFSFTTHNIAIKQVYVCDNFFIDDAWEAGGVLSEYEVVVSPANKQLKATNGIPFFQKDGTPCLCEYAKGLYAICRNKKWGVIDAKLKQILPFKYDSFWSGFDKNGLIKVEIQDGRKHYWGLVNTKGVEIVPVVYERIDEHLNGTYTVKKDGGKFTIDKFGNRIK